MNRETAPRGNRGLQPVQGHAAIQTRLTMEVRFAMARNAVTIASNGDGGYSAASSSGARAAVLDGWGPSGGDRAKALPTPRRDQKALCQAPGATPHGTGLRPRGCRDPRTRSSPGRLNRTPHTLYRMHRSDSPGKTRCPPLSRFVEQNRPQRAISAMSAVS